MPPFAFTLRPAVAVLAAAPLLAAAAFAGWSVGQHWPAAALVLPLLFPWLVLAGWRLRSRAVDGRGLPRGERPSRALAGTGPSGPRGVAADNRLAGASRAGAPRTGTTRDAGDALGPRTGAGTRDHAVPPAFRTHLRKGGKGLPDEDPELDPLHLAELRAVVGADGTRRLLTRFAHELEARPAAIHAAIGRNDFAEAAAEAHRLGGATLSVGGHWVGNAAATLAQALTLPSPDQAEQLHDAVRELDRAVAATSAMLPRAVQAIAWRAA